MSKFQSWRPQRAHKPDKPDVIPDVPATKFFDNLSFIGNINVGCFLLETTEGLILLDNMNPGDAEFIERGIIDLGYDPKDVKHILITHGHGDHFGNADYFQKKYGTKLWMSEIDEEFAKRDDRYFPNGKKVNPMPFDMDGHLVDGGVFEFGDASIETFWTPGHTPGCMSFIFDVYDEGRPHKVAMWGGTGLPSTLEDRKLLLQSCDDFAEKTLARGVDVEISSHPFVDLSVERLVVVRKIVDGVANPFVIGYEGYRAYEQMFHNMYVNGVKALEEK